MNPFVNINELPEYQLEEKEEPSNITFGDIFAVSVVGLYAFSGLAVSGWSAILLMTGNPSGPNPLGLIIDLLKISGLVS